ncbi:MAG: hypothetical protein AAGH68_08495 [Pseudomonadota bacterium]
MTRGWFLAGSSCMFAVAFAIQFLMTADDGQGLLDFLPVWLRLLSSIAICIAAWSVLFLPWRMLFRRRLARRYRPLWWADLPGLTAFISIIELVLAFAARLITGEAVFALAPWLTSEVAVAAFLGPIALGMTLALLLTLECLRPDRTTDAAQVFD